MTSHVPTPGEIMDTLEWLLAEARWYAEQHAYREDTEIIGDEDRDLRGELPWWPACPFAPNPHRDGPGHDLEFRYGKPSRCLWCHQEFPR